MNKEIRGILSRRDLLVGTMLILTVCMHFLYVQADGISVKKLQLRREIWQEYSSLCETQTYDEIRQYLIEKQEASDSLEEEIYAECLDFLTYPDEYSVWINQLLSDEKLSFAQFQTSGSYASKNAEKTKNDFRNCRTVLATWGHGGVKAAAAAWEESAVGFVLLVWLVYLLFAHYLSRNSGERLLFFSLARGRRRRAVDQMLWICGKIFLFSCALTLCLVSLSFSVYGGWKDFSLSAQSIPALQNCVLAITIAQLFACRCIAAAAACCAAACFLWAVLWLFDSTAVAVLIWGICFAVSFLFLQWIPRQGKANILRYTNIWALIHAETCFSEYRNLDIGGYLVSNCFVFFMYLLLLAGGSIAAVCVLSEKREFSFGVGLQRWFHGFFQKWNGAAARLEQRLSVSAFLFEQLMFRKGVVICFLVFSFLAVQIYQADSIRYSPIYQILMDFYEEWEGPLDEVMEQRVLDWGNEVDGWEEAFSEAQEDYLADRISFEEYDNSRLIYEMHESEISAYHEVAGTLEYLKELSEERGCTLWMVNPVGFTVLLGEDGWSLYQNLCLILFFFLGLTTAGFEKSEEGWKYFLRTLPHGRRVLYRKRKNCVRCAALLYGLIAEISQLLYVLNSYGIHAWNASVWSLELGENIPISISVGTYYAWICLIRLGFVVLIEDIFYEFSVLYSSHISVGAGFLLFMFPGIVQLLGFPVPAVFLWNYWVETSQAIVTGQGRELLILALILLLADTFLDFWAQWSIVHDVSEIGIFRKPKGGVERA